MKGFAITLVLLIAAFATFYYVQIYGWMSFQKRSNTPSKFMSRVEIGNEKYNVDKKLLLSEFAILLKDRKEFFHDTSFTDSTTQIIIDTIVYSPDLKKIVVMIIAKNPTSKQLLPEKNHRWFYNSTCYLGVKRGLKVELKMLGPTFTNEETFESASEDIRNACFMHFIEKGSAIYTFNINDNRFWRSKIWSYYFQ
jgi:hypothetical protein